MTDPEKQGALAGASFGVRMFLAVPIGATIATLFDIPINNAGLAALVIVFFPRAIGFIIRHLFKATGTIGKTTVEILSGLTKGVLNIISNFFKKK